MKILNEIRNNNDSLDFGQLNVRDENKDVSEELRKSLNTLVSKHINEETGAVDYASLGASVDYKKFSSFSKQLNFCHPETFGREDVLAFFLNIYNVLTIHALTDFQEETKISSVLEIPEFWKSFGYTIGHHTFSLDDIEHGILRANKPHPTSGIVMFGENDPRKKFSLAVMDPRIHFALNCGAKSCPLIRAYSSQHIDQKLDMVTSSYLTQEITVNEDVDGRKIVYLPQLFEWYGEDFASDFTGVLRWMMPYLDIDRKEVIEEIVEEGVEGLKKIQFLYDWSLNK